MNGLTAQQKESLKTWSDQRDALLREVSLLQNQKDTLQKESIVLGQSNNELQLSIAENKGRLIEIKEVEDRYRNSLSNDIAKFIAEKSKIEEEIVTKKEQLKLVESKKDEVISSINVLLKTHDQFFDRLSSLETIAEDIQKVSKVNINELKSFANDLKKSFEDVIAVNTSNVAQTKIILDKLPRYIFELQKPIPVRRIDRKTFIKPDNKEI